MRILSLLFLLFFLFELHAQVLVYTDSTAKQGDVVPVLIRAAGGQTVESCRLCRNDTVLNEAGPVLLIDAGPAGDTQLYLCLIGISYSVSPGPAQISVLTGEQESGFSTPLEIGPRDFISETITLNSLLTDIRTANREIRRREARELTSLLQSFNPDAVFANRVFRFPIVNAEWWPSSFYGDIRTYIYADGSKAYSRHGGLDYAASKGSEVCSSVNGRVAMVRSRQVTGNTVVIEFWPGIYLLYFHLDSIIVNEGETVQAGQKIGTVGSTGLATGDHLHWEMRVNNAEVDPELFLQKLLIDKKQLMGMIEGHQ
ncbi:MAG: M23 family metallopeptidase [Spirochaetales bacterium]|nr:M23 family metallopeptidase [Spirochaetales bacterium]